MIEHVCVSLHCVYNSDGTMIERNRKSIDFTLISINQSESQKFRLIKIQKVLRLAIVFSLSFP